MFNVVNFVIGGGHQDVAVHFDGRMNLDMLFISARGYRLGLEYDGAYWHRGREESDWRKSQRLVSEGVVHDLVRVREAPLNPIGELDLVVPRGLKGQEVASLTLLHLAHTVASAFGEVAQERIDFHISLPGQPFNHKDLTCRDCKWAAERFRRTRGTVANRY